MSTLKGLDAGAFRAHFRWRSVLSAAAAIALALYVVPLFLYLGVLWDPSHYGQFGLTLAQDSNAVAEVDSGSPAYEAGIRAGDRVDRPQTLRTRLLLGATYVFPIAPRPKERITISTSRGGHTARILEARPLGRLSLIDGILLLIKLLWLFLFLAIALVLVLLSPNMVTWGFYLFAVNLTLIFGFIPLSVVPTFLPTGALVAYELAAAVIAPAGLAGFLIFCVAFPRNVIEGWRTVIVGLAPLLTLTFTSYYVYEAVEAIRFQFAPPPRGDYSAGGYGDFLILALFVIGLLLLLRIYHKTHGAQRHETKWATFALAGSALTFFLEDTVVGLPAFSIFLLGAAVLLITYFSVDALERHRISWVMLGFFCAFAATTVDFLWDRLSIHPAWYTRTFELLYVVLPLTVAYAVIRHRVIDLRFVVSRSLVLGVIASIVLLSVVGIDWLFSSRLPSSRLQVAAYVGLALVVGFSLNTGWRSIGKTIDFVFFHRWYRTREQAEIIADAARHAASKLDLYKPVTAGIAKAFSLTSAALFERLEDGGFLRVAAHGWPRGTTWHILPDDQLLVHLDKRRRIVSLEDLRWKKHDLPTGAARPMVALPLVTRGGVVAILLYGAHENGTALDPGEMRTIRRLCADAVVIYGRPHLEQAPNAFLGEPSVV